MSLEIIFNCLTVAVEFLLSAILIFKWARVKIKFYSDLPFLFGVSILFIGFSTLLNLIYSITFFIQEIILFQARGVLICITAVTMFIGVLKIWLPENYKLLISGGLIYTISFLTILFISTSPTQIVAYTSPFIAINIILVVATFGVVYVKHRLPLINSPLIILGSLVILISQLVKAFSPILSLLLIPDLISIIGWSIFTLGFLLKAPYFRAQSQISL